MAEDVTEGFDDLIAVELVGIPFLDPRAAGVRLIGGVERLQLALGVEVSLHVGNGARGRRCSPANSFKTFRNTRRMRSRPVPLPWAALLSMLKRMTSVSATTARLMSPHSKASFTLLSEELHRPLALAVGRVDMVLEQIRQAP